MTSGQPELCPNCGEVLALLKGLEDLRRNLSREPKWQVADQPRVS
jgi:hypothetical protein